MNVKRNYLEMFFRHRWLVIPLVLVPLVAVGVAFNQPRHYVSTTDIWSDASIPNGSTIEQTAGGPSPSSGQQALLDELLVTHQFLLAVAERTPLAHYVETHPRQQVDRALTTMANEITSQTPGPQVLSVAVKDTSPTMARAIAHAVGSEFVSEEVNKLTSRDQAVMSFQQKQMSAILQALSSTQGIGGSNAQSAAGSAAQVTMMASSTALAQEYANAQQKYDEAQADLAGVGNPSVLGLIDGAGPAQRVGRSKTLLLAGVGGVLGGLALMTLLLAFLMARDKTVWGPADIKPESGLVVVAAVERVDAAQERASFSEVKV